MRISDWSSDVCSSDLSFCAVIPSAPHIQPARPWDPHPLATLPRMTRFAAWLLYLLAAALGRLPWAWLRGLGDALAWGWRRAGARESVVAARNLDMAYPDLLPLQRDNLQRATLRTTAYQALETLHLWTHRHARNLELIRTHDGSELFDAALAAGSGVIVA